MLEIGRMDGVSVKSEGSPRRRGSDMVEADMSVPKCVKRRRRSPAVIALNDHNGVQQQPQAALKQVGDNSSAVAPTTTTVKRSSKFRGVSRHRWTGRYEAHLWDKGSWNATQRKKGKQVYLGAYDEEESAARAYDLAALKYWGTATFTNFPVSDYEKEVEIMENVTKEEYLASLRRRSSGFSRGVSKYRGVARHHHNGRWEARIGRVFGNKYLYLGTYSTQEEAAHAYDIAAIEYRGINAVTNFDLSTYIRWLRSSSGTASIPPQGPMIASSNSHQPLQTNIHPIIDPIEEAQFSFATNPFRLSIPQNQELPETKMPPSPSNQSSAPTAVGLLLRSSMFKELVNKNLTADDEQETEENGMRNNTSKTEGNEFRGIFFNGMCPLKVENLTGLDLEDKSENELPLFSGTTTRRQSLWGGSINMNM